MRPLTLLLIVLLLSPPSAVGQSVPPAPPAGEAPAFELPVSLDRIKRRLAESPPTPGDGLRLSYYVEVHGRAPVIDLFTDFDLKSGPIPFGAPTHQEFLNLWTPEEFRAPAADLLTPALALLKWLARDRGTDKR